MLCESLSIQRLKRSQRKQNLGPSSGRGELLGKSLRACTKGHCVVVVVCSTALILGTALIAEASRRVCAYVPAKFVAVVFFLIKSITNLKNKLFFFPANANYIENLPRRGKAGHALLDD